MKVVNIHEAKTHLSAILAEIEAEGSVYLICRNGRPVARLAKHSTRDRLTPDPILSRLELHYDPTEPLADEDWPEPS